MITDSKKPRLAVFDVEGVLVPKYRLFFDVAKRLSLSRLFYLLFFGFLYEIGLMPLKMALKKIFKNMKGANVELLSQVFIQLPLMPCSNIVFAELKAQGCKTALISSGFPTFLVEKLGAEVGADYAIGTEVGIKDNILTGEVSGKVIEPNGKFLILKELMKQQEITSSDCVVVADDRNNSSIFLKDSLKVAFNPDFVLRAKADRVVTGRLTKILPIIYNTYKKKEMPTQRDLLRESIHASGIFIPILSLMLGIPIVAVFICIVIFFYCLSEFLRVRGICMPFFSLITKHAASHSELWEFTLAPVYFALGILLTLLLLPAPASYGGIAVFVLGDSAASLFGGTISDKPLPFNKSKTLEGSIFGFFFAFLACSVFVGPLKGLVGAAVGMIVEYLPLPVNDNLVMPLISGLSIMLVV